MMIVLRAGALGMVEDQSRPDLADGRRAVALVARELQDRGFVEIIAGEMLVDVTEDRIAFQERRQGLAGAGHLEAGIDRVGEIAGVAEHMPGRHDGRIRGSESRKQRMTVAQAHALAGNRRHGRSGAVVDRAETKPVGDVKNHIVRPRCRRLRQRRRQCGGGKKERSDKQAKHDHGPESNGRFGGVG